MSFSPLPRIISQYYQCPAWFDQKEYPWCRCSSWRHNTHCSFLEYSACPPYWFWYTFQTLLRVKYQIFIQLLNLSQQWSLVTCNDTNQECYQPQCWQLSAHTYAILAASKKDRILGWWIGLLKQSQRAYLSHHFFQPQVESCTSTIHSRQVFCYRLSSKTNYDFVYLTCNGWINCNLEKMTSLVSIWGRQTFLFETSSWGFWMLNTIH